MPNILTCPAWDSSAAGPYSPASDTKNPISGYYKKLAEAAKSHWQAHFRKSPYTAAQLVMNQLLNRNASGIGAEQARLFSACLQRMDQCRPETPCGIFRCRRCAASLLYKLTNQMAETIAQYTNTKRGFVLAIGVGSSRWNGQIHNRKFTIQHEITVIRHLLDNLPEVDGFRLSLDATPMKSATAEIGFQLHLHGTVLCRHRNAEKLIEKLESLLRQNGIEVELWLKTMSSRRGQDTTFLHNKLDIARWISYSEKIQTVNFSSKLHVELHKELHDMPTSWMGGLLSRAGQPSGRRQLARLQFELDSIQTLHRQHGVELEFSGSITTMLNQIAEVQRLDRLRSERERKRHERRRDAFADQRSMYNRQKLPAVRAEWEAKSEQRRAKFRERLAAQKGEYDTVWRNLLRNLDRLLRRTVLRLANMERVSASSFARYVAQASHQAAAGRTSLLEGAVTICSQLVNLRRRLVDFMRIGGGLDQYPSFLVSAVAIKEQLERLNNYWPAIGPTESLTGLNWKKFWSAWRKLILRLL